MPLRPPAGFISAFFDPLNNPNAPTIGTATEGNASASVAFTPPANVGGSAISSYSAISSPEGIIGSAASSPVTVTGLTNGTAYTFAVWATNTYGPSAFSASSGSVTPALQRGVFGGGLNNGNFTNVIQYVNIASTGNATDFGDLNYSGTGGTSACSSATRGVFGGGYSNGRTNTMDYITIATTGNAVNFGSLALPSGDSSTLGVGSASNSTRGLWAGGNPTVGVVNVIQYITIATTGNSTSFWQSDYFSVFLYLRVLRQHGLCLLEEEVFHLLLKLQWITLLRLLLEMQQVLVVYLPPLHKWLWVFALLQPEGFLRR